MPIGSTGTDNLVLNTPRSGSKKFSLALKNLIFATGRELFEKFGSNNS